MTDNTNGSSCSTRCCGLGTILLMVVMLAGGFALGHFAADMNWIRGGSPKLPEAKQNANGSSTSSRGRNERPTQEDAEAAVDDATEHEPELPQMDAAENTDEAGDDSSGS